jgi:excisionase family DNA binding protein
MSELKFIEPFLDSDQAAAILRIHPKTLQRLARCGQVTGYRIGKLWRFHASDLEGHSDSFSSTLDSDTAERYALSTTCVRN